MIAVGVSDSGHGVVATVPTNLYHGFTAVTNIVFAFCEWLMILFMFQQN